jgi:hypothetical protein
MMPLIPNREFWNAVARYLPSKPPPGSGIVPCERNLAAMAFELNLTDDIKGVDVSSLREFLPQYPPEFPWTIDVRDDGGDKGWTATFTWR